MKLRFRVSGLSEPLVVEVDPTLHFGVLPFAVEAELPPNALCPADEMAFLAGFPPKPVTAKEDVTLSTLFKDGEMLILQRRSASADSLIRRGTTDGKYVPPCDERGVFVRRAMPGDNSCLFHAAAYILQEKTRGKEAAAALRAQCAEAVAANPSKFTTAILGMPNRQYCEWIMNPNTWGGAIELHILSFLFQTEIIALDVKSHRMENFGRECGYTTRGYVVYTGDHYDAMAMTRSQGGVSTMGGLDRDDQVLFNPRDTRAADAADAFIASERRAKERSGGMQSQSQSQ